MGRLFFVSTGNGEKWYDKKNENERSASVMKRKINLIGLFVLCLMLISATVLASPKSDLKKVWDSQIFGNARYQIVVDTKMALFGTVQNRSIVDVKRDPFFIRSEDSVTMFGSTETATSYAVQDGDKLRIYTEETTKGDDGVKDQWVCYEETLPSGEVEEISDLLLSFDEFVRSVKLLDKNDDKQLYHVTLDGRAFYNSIKKYHEKGSVLPLESAPQSNARCAMLLEGGAVTVPSATEGNILTFILFSEKEIYCFDIAVKSVSDYRFNTRLAHVGYLTEILTLGNVGNMDLDRGDRNGLERVKDRYACVSICRRIDDDTVVNVKRFLYFIDDHALVIGLKNGNVYSLFIAMLVDHIAKKLITLVAVDRRLADTEHIKIRAVDYKYFHSLTSLIIALTFAFISSTHWIRLSQTERYISYLSLYSFLRDSKSLERGRSSVGLISSILRSRK